MKNTTFEKCSVFYLSPTGAAFGDNKECVLEAGGCLGGLFWRLGDGGGECVLVAVGPLRKHKHTGNTMETQ